MMILRLLKKAFIWKGFGFELRCERGKWKYIDLYFDGLKQLLCNAFTIR